MKIIMHTARKRGFTLIEILVVIAILAALALVVVMTLNPSELLKQSRDSNRMSDLTTLNNAINLYISDTGAAAAIGAANTCYAHASSSVVCSNRFATGGTASTSASTAGNGTGWLPVNFNAISSGAPVSNLPVDPKNDTTYFYAYKPDTITLRYKLDAKMESKQYRSGGGGDVESTDGGTNPNLYEVGTELTL